MQAPGGPGENWDGGVDHGGWSTGYWDDRMNEIMGGITGRPFDLLLGRKTYEVFAAHWSNTDQPGVDVFWLIESAQARWHAVNAPHLVALVRAGARFEKGKLVERPDESGGDQQAA
jgi:dihydrofolate reductase